MVMHMHIKLMFSFGNWLIVATLHTRTCTHGSF